jgi:integrase
MRRYYGPIRRGRRWYALVYDDVTRRRTQLSLHTDRVTVARKILENMRVEEFLRPTGTLARVLTTAARAAEQWIAELHRTAAASTIQMAERCISRVLTAVGAGIRLGDIGPEHVRSYLADRAETVAASTANTERRLLSWWLSWCERQGLLERNPVHAVAPAPEADREVRALAPDEEVRLLATVDRMGSPVDLFARLGLWTGLRRAALSALRWEWLDLEDGMLHVPAEAQKGHKSLVVPLDPRAVAILRDRRAAVEGTLFPVQGDRLYRLLMRAYARAGIAGASTHTLRATFYSRLLEKGVAPEVAARLMGHSGISVGLKCYRAIRPDELRKAFD